jgi:hypothetical protein
MSPAWEYRTPTTMSHAVWKEVKETAWQTGVRVLYLSSSWGY